MMRGRIRPELSRKSWRLTRERIRIRDHNTCQVCGAQQPPFARRRFPVGHIIPPERYPGHHDDPANLRLMCWRCNASQSNRTMDEWRAARSGRLVELGIAEDEIPAPRRAFRSTLITGDYTRRSYGGRRR